MTDQGQPVHKPSPLNTTMLTAILAIAGTVGLMVIRQGNTLSGIEQILISHSNALSEMTPFMQKNASINAVFELRLNADDKRMDHQDDHMAATDHRVDVIQTETEHNGDRIGGLEGRRAPH